MAIKTSSGHFMGWRPDTPDIRDHQFDRLSLLYGLADTLPAKVDLSAIKPGMPGVYDQGEIGSCTGNAIAAAVEYVLRRQPATREFVPSRLFIYYNERYIEGTVASDAGAEIRDGIKAVAQWGVCSESPQADPAAVWPYRIDQFTVHPPTECYTAALRDLVRNYSRVSQDLPSMQRCLAGGWPIVFGFSVYASFESDEVARTGIVPMPGTTEAQEGGHAVLCVGYDDSTKMFKVRNSWGPGWGDRGYCYIPYDYLLNPNLADDFWTMDVVGGT